MRSAEYTGCGFLAVSRLAIRVGAPLAAIAAWVAPAMASWPSDPTANLSVVSASANQNIPFMISDGAGNAFVVWTDGRSGGRDIYAGHVLATGVNDPAWPLNGQSVCLASGDQTNAVLVQDMSGGALIAWQDLRNGSQDIFVQRIGSTGLASPGWPANGLAVCTAADSQVTPVAVSDGEGGAFVAWQDRRSGTSMDVYAHHVLSGGALDPDWPAQGMALCTAAGRQERLSIISDFAGGAIVAWSDQRAGIGSDDVFAVRIQASGAVAPGWPANGLGVCTASGPQRFPAMVPDGSGGAFLTWADERSVAGSPDIYAQHALASGAADPGWTADGVAVCTALGSQSSPAIVESGSHGALIVWTDTRSGATADVYAGRLLLTGALDPAWPADGRALCSALNSQATVMVARDGYGGAIATWTDFRASLSNPDIYAQHVSSAGVVDPQWTVDGVAVSVANGSQASPKLVADGSGGAVIVWTDSRNGSTNADVYAQRIQANGSLGGDVVGVASRGPGSLRLGPLQPNPLRGSTARVGYRLSVSEAAHLELFDLSGRRIAKWHLSGDDASGGVIQLDGLPSLSPGVYQLRLTQLTESTTLRFAVL